MMKRWIHASNENELVDFNLKRIVSLVFVSDAADYEPRDSYVSASKKANQIDYSSLNREQLLQLPKKILQGIHDIKILRKLEYRDLTLQQQREVTQANKQKFRSLDEKVIEVLDILKKQRVVNVWPSQKYNDFLSNLAAKGCDVTPRDVRNIIAQLEFPRDYAYSTLSYLAPNWNALLMIFDFNGSYTFHSYDDEEKEITVPNLKIYIKIDVDNKTGDGYAAISFHEPSHPIHHLKS